MIRTPAWSRALVLSVVTAAFGCGRASLPTRPVVPVAVEVIVQGKPAVNAFVTLHPVQSDPENFMVGRPSGVVGVDGMARLTTYHSNDGAPEGDYVATVIWPPPPRPGSRSDDPLGSDKLGGRYSNPAKSPLRVSVAKESETLRIQLPK